MPEAEQLIFPAVQTYSDGEVVRWIELPTPGGEEPELPAPVLTLVPAATHATPAATPGPAAAPTVQPAAAEPKPSDTDATARWLAGAALAIGLAAGLLAGLSRRRPTPATGGRPAG